MNDAAAQAQSLSALLAFQHTLQHCKSRRELQFAIVNDSHRLLQHDQALLIEPGLRGSQQLSAVSGLGEIDLTTPFAQWLGHVARWLEQRNEAQVVLSPTLLPEDLAADGSDWMPAHALACRLAGPGNQPSGWLWLGRSTPWQPNDLALAQWLAENAGFALWGWRSSQPRLRHLVRGLKARPTLALIIGVIVLLGFVPVPLTVLAPAEVTPVHPTAITAPTDGVVERVLVQPNQLIKAGEVLVSLDNTVTRNRLQVARKTLEISLADLKRATSKAFADDQSKSEVQMLDARAHEKAAEVDYLVELLDRLKVKSPINGVAIFADPLDWLGKPVQTGERIMLVADPEAVDLTLYVPADDAIELDIDTPVRMFLNVSPLGSIAARVTQTSYEAVPNGENTLAYVLKARIDEHTLPRLGLKGTAKLYSHKVSLAYYLFRKPLAWLRRASGL